METKFIFRDVFPLISSNIEYCTNVFAAENCMDDYQSVHDWLTANEESVLTIYNRMPHFGFYITNSDKEAEFVQKFEGFMAPVDIDGKQ